MSTILVSGASGYVGGRLLAPLLAAGHRVRAMSRSPDGARLPAGVEPVRADVTKPETLRDALHGVDVAYYLVHSMERGSSGFADRDRRGAEAFARAAKQAADERVIYLGGLRGGDSAHLRSREEVAVVLRAYGPRLVHVRAAMIIGGASASFVMLRSLVDRLPAMIAPRWIETRTQPVAITDVTRALVTLAGLPDPPAEVELGGADVLTYREMMLRYARVAGRRRRPILRVPVLTPRLSSYWVQLVTPVDGALARPLVAGLSAEMLVEHPPPAGLNDQPQGFEEAVRAALDLDR